MKRDKSFHDYVIYDVLSGFDNISSKPMFSGWGIYKNSKIFAIIAENTLYLKGDGEKSAIYESGGGEQFEYEKKNTNKPIKLPYWSVPEEVLEDREAFSYWIRTATGS